MEKLLLEARLRDGLAQPGRDGSGGLAAAPVPAGRWSRRGSQRDKGCQDDQAKKVQGVHKEKAFPWGQQGRGTGYSARLCQLCPRGFPALRGHSPE